VIKPLFPFYGSKWRDAKRYPAPGSLVIEPFAGSAGYSLWHEPERVILYDVDPCVVGVWRYLIGADPERVYALPDLDLGQSTDELDVTQAERWLIGFWLNRGSATPKKTQTAYSRRTDRAQLVWSERARERIASSVHRIRHWQVSLGQYDWVPRDPRATFFVDPPYLLRGKHYRCHRVDHAAIGQWAMRLPGTVIVCEQAGANWLPFRYLATIKSTKARSVEVVWTQRDRVGLDNDYESP
jgi:hypothetical protein